MSSGKIAVAVIILVLAAAGILISSDILPSANDEFTHVDYVVDGDTIRTTNGDSIRFLGINTPERGVPYADKATERLEELLGGGEIRLEGDVADKDGYGRLLRYVWAGDVHVNLEMVRSGYAHVYVIEPNSKYWDELKEAEAEAIAAKRGLWEPSPYDVVISDFQPIQLSGDAGLNYETITFTNNGDDPINMTYWNVKDEATHMYGFDDITFEPGTSISLASGTGTDSNITVYWGSDSSIWNNNGDVIFLRDENGLLVDGLRYWEEGDSYIHKKLE